MTDTEHIAHDIYEPSSEIGRGAYFALGLILGFMTVGLLGMIVLTNNDTNAPLAVGEVATTTAGGTEGPPGPGGDAVAGQEIYSGTCAACHGPTAEGITGLGLPLANSPFVQSMSDDELVAFIAVGRGADDPVNTTGVGMPPKGGNPSLDEDDLLDVVAYLRTLQP